jgi:uncharacterized protein YbjT (DUF2867 family)
MHGNMTMTTSTSEADVLGLAAAARFDAMTTTLVLGSTGKTGRWVVQRLAASGIPSRGGSRSGEPPFDWEDRSTWAPGSRRRGIGLRDPLPGRGPGRHGDSRLVRRAGCDSGIPRLLLLSGRGEERARAGR